MCINAWEVQGASAHHAPAAAYHERMGLGTVRAGNIEKIRSWLSARNANLIVIDTATLDALSRGELREDGLHFTPAGYAIFAERILPQVLAVLGR